MAAMKWVRPVVVGTGAFLGVSIALATLGSAMTGYGSARRESVALRVDLAQSVQSSATDLYHGLRINVDGLTPGAQLVDRCDANELPAALEAKHVDVCAAAALEEIQEEQEQSNVTRKAGDDARALERKLSSVLEEAAPSEHWTAVVSGFTALSGLESSTRCGADRVALIRSIESPSQGTPALDDDVLPRTQLLDANLKAALQRAFPDSIGATERLDDALRVGDGLLGGAPTDVTGRCDNHGRAFSAAFTVVAVSLQDETRIVADEILHAHAVNLDDKIGDVGRSLLSDPFFIVPAMAAIGAWVFTQIVPKPKGPPTEVKLVGDGEPPTKT